MTKRRQLDKHNRKNHFVQSLQDGCIFNLKKKIIPEDLESVSNSRREV
jgi:hypothetical protein